jgi:glutathione synthase/RimK-type ligase-like ATP-grasp enzyme
MTLYGLDFVKARDGRHFLIEINGINSGMEGFKKIYGDDRVRLNVVEMLYKAHPVLSYNSGKYSEQKWQEQHPKTAKIKSFLDKHERIKKPLENASEKLADFIERAWAQSELAEKEFITQSKQEKNATEDRWPKQYCIPEYTGQESTVINLYNEILPHPLVNPYVNEELTNNKFFQYTLLNNTPIQRHLPPTTLVGLGVTDESAIRQMTQEYDMFVVKPMAGSLGLGVKFMSSEEIKEKYIGSSGAVSKDYNKLRLDAVIDRKSPVMIEDLVKMEKFGFEYYISVIQPFINSKTSKNGKYKSIRAIVCNGKFVDAYSRVSSLKCVNIACGADAEPLEHDDNFRTLCEQTVRCFENATPQCEPKLAKPAMYSSYLKNVREKNQEAGFKQIPEIIPLEERSFVKSYAMFYPAVYNHMMNIVMGKMKK